MLTQKYPFLGYCFSLTINNTAGIKHKNALLKSFMFSEFHALRDYNLTFIFQTFLKAYGIASDEILDVNEIVLDQGMFNHDNLLPTLNHSGQSSSDKNDVQPEPVTGTVFIFNLSYSALFYQ